MERQANEVELGALLGSRLRRNEPLARHTSFRIGGPADYWVEVESPEEIRRVQEWTHERRIPLYILGGGTNVLVSDLGVRGCVLHLGRRFAFLEWKPNGACRHVRAGAALPLKKLVRQAVERNLSGLEFAEGIPGTVGGGLLMNAGAFGGELADVLIAVEVVSPAGAFERLPREQLRFGYRYFDLAHGTVVTAAEFVLVPGRPEEIRIRCQEAKAKRERHQPRGLPNAGSIFKNPPGQFAGRLLEAAGLKGYRVGGAMFSPRHANFIVNVGGARAEDVWTLMCEAQRRVREQFGIQLEPEVRLLGEWRA